MYTWLDDECITAVTLVAKNQGDLQNRDLAAVFLVRQDTLQTAEGTLLAPRLSVYAILGSYSRH